MSVASEVTVSRVALAALAPLFSFPDENFAKHADAARALVSECDSTAGCSLDELVSTLRGLTAATREITFTSTFDLAPSCSPYLGVHLFGDESRDRARLMVGLRGSFTAGGYDSGSELPDHIAVVLSFATRFEEEEWRDLLRLVLLPALEKMEALLASTPNPYRHLISATRSLTRAAIKEGGWA